MPRLPPLLPVIRVRSTRSRKLRVGPEPLTTLLPRESPLLEQPRSSLSRIVRSMALRAPRLPASTQSPLLNGRITVSPTPVERAATTWSSTIRSRAFFSSAMRRVISAISSLRSAASIRAGMRQARRSVDPMSAIMARSTATTRSRTGPGGGSSGES